MRTGRAATYILIALLGLCYVLAWVTKSPLFVKDMWFDGNWSHPWTALTYPFASEGMGGALIWELFLLWWLYWIGSDLEREIGAARVFGIFLISSLIGACCVDVAWIVTHRFNMPLMSSIIPIGALTVAWGTRNLNASIRLYAVIPITGKWIAIIEAVLVLFVVGDGNPVAGVFALVPLALAWAYAANRLPGVPFGKSAAKISKAAKATERRDKSYYDDVFRRAKEREERERLRKLFESSLDDDK
jgi:membrane associated rhomboid family serine protease